MSYEVIWEPEAVAPGRSAAARGVRHRQQSETLPATHEAMIWTAATRQLSNRLTR